MYQPMPAEGLVNLRQPIHDEVEEDPEDAEMKELQGRLSSNEPIKTTVA